MCNLGNVKILLKTTVHLSSGFVFGNHYSRRCPILEIGLKYPYVVIASFTNSFDNIEIHQFNIFTQIIVL